MTSILQTRHALLAAVAVSALGALTVYLFHSPPPESPSPAVQEQVQAAAMSGPREGARLSFTDVAAEKGINHLMSTWGISWNDFNNDGLPDLFTADHMHFPSALYVNEGGLWFERDVEKVGFPIGFDDHIGAWGDYDGNGTQDLYTASGFFRPVTLFSNRGDGNFEEVSGAAGLQQGRRGSGRDALWADFNGDGWLDLVTFNTSSADKFHINRGNGTFRDATRVSRLANSLSKKGGLHGDLDSDGDSDLLILTDAGPLLFMNRGDGTFVENSTQAGLVFSRRGHNSAALGDYDNDGDLDVFFVSGWPGDRLFQNQGNATFVDVTRQAGFETESTRGASAEQKTAGFADFDNDGWLDIYVVQGGEENDLENTPNILYLNRGDGSFDDITTKPSDVAGHGSGKSVVGSFADFNGDGFLDIAVSQGGGSRQISGPVILLQNAALTNPADNRCGHWVIVHPDKRHGSRDGYGATLRVRLPDGKILHRQAASSQRPMAQDGTGVHFGLGCAPYIEQITVTWPDGSSAHLGHVPINGHVLAEAEKAAYRIRSHPAGLLGQVPGRDETFYEQISATLPASVVVQAGREEDIRNREDALLAWARVSELANGISVPEEEIDHFYQEHKDHFIVPERFWLERVLLGVFMPRKNPPPLPWEVAKKVKKAFETEDRSAVEIADEINIIAWGTTDRKVGRYWDIKGETRGYTEGGWFTRQMLEERFGTELAAQIASVQAGKVIGPVKRKESFVLHDTNKAPFILEVIKVVRKEPARSTGLDQYREEIRRFLWKRELAEVITQEGRASAGEGNSVERHGYYNSVRYNIATLARVARERGLQDQPYILTALENVRREAALDEAVRKYLDEQPLPEKAVESYIRSRRQDWRQESLLPVRYLFFSHLEDGERVVTMIEKGKSIEDIIAEMNIPNKSERKGRGASIYYEDTLLSERIIGHDIFQVVEALQVGQLSPLMESEKNHYLYRSENRAAEGAFDPGTATRIAEKELHLRREGKLINIPATLSIESMSE